MDEALRIAVGHDRNDRATHFDIAARPPMRRLIDGPPTQDMRDAFERFYGCPVGRLRRSQVVAMLAYGSFGRALVPSLGARIASAPIFFSRLIAAFVANRHAIARDVVRRYRIHGEFRAGQPELKALEYYDLIARMCREACAALSDEGVAPTRLSSVSIGDRQHADL